MVIHNAEMVNNGNLAQHTRAGKNLGF